MGRKAFLSKSRQAAKDKLEKLEQTRLAYPNFKPVQINASTEKNFIAWIGKGFPTQNCYGFKNLDISKFDLSILINAKLLIIIHTGFSPKVSATVNFAFEFGVPILWINNISPPKNKAWFFDAVSNDIYWELICQMAK